MKVKGLITAIVVVCLMITMIIGCSSKRKAASADKSPYLIGAVFDITGQGSPLGIPERDTVLMIEKQINDEGGINGHPVKFIIEDNGSDETKCIDAVKKLIEKDHVKAIIGPSSTGTTLAVAGICEKAEIPLISCAAGIKIVDPTKPFVFKTAQSDVHAVEKVIDYLKSQKITAIGFISDSNPFGKSGLEQILLQSANAKIKVAATEIFGSADTDMTAQLTRIGAKNPQAVICWGTNPGPAIVAENMKQLGMKIPLIMSHGIANKKFIELAGDAAEGIVFPSGRIITVEDIPDSDPQKKVLKEYTELFKNTYKRDADAFGGYAWDAAELVLKAMLKVGDDPALIRDEIENTKRFVGVSGVFDMSADDHNGLTKDAFVIVQIKNGKWTLLKQ